SFLLHERIRRRRCEGHGSGGCVRRSHGAVFAAAWTLIAGAICALILLIARGEHFAIAALPRRWMWHVFSAYYTGRPAPVVAGSGDPTRRRFPYGLAIACGTAFSLLWSTR